MGWWRVRAQQVRQITYEVEADDEDGAVEAALNEAEGDFNGPHIVWDLVPPEVEAVERMER